MSEADEWAALIKELEDKKMMTAKLSLTDFTIPELILPPIEDAMIQSWHSTIH